MIWNRRLTVSRRRGCVNGCQRKDFLEFRRLFLKRFLRALCTHARLSLQKIYRNGS